MGELENVEVCMAPSVALRTRESSSMGGIAEQVVLHDYLRDTLKFPPLPFITPSVTNADWWDTGNQQHYKQILLQRHKHLDEGQLRRLRRLRVPDMSTWGGEHRRDGQLVPGFSAARSELYEVKPDSVWGEAAGVEKLADIRQNNQDLGLNGYAFGTWYPAPPGTHVVARKQLPFEDYVYVIRSFEYSLRRMERAARRAGVRLKIGKVMLEIERRRPGLITYMVCVKLGLDFDGEDAIAKKVVWRLYKALTTNLTERQRQFELELAASLRPYRDRKPLPPKPPDPVTVSVLKQIAIEEQYLAREIQVVEELRPCIPALAQTLFSRLRGLPGDRYILCADETYFQNEILGPRRLRMKDQLAPLRLRPPIPMQPRLAIGGVMNKVMSPVLATLYVLGHLVAHPEDVFTAKEQWLKAKEWLDQRPAFTLVVGSAVVYGTALTIASAGSAGALAVYGGGGLAALGGLGTEIAGIGLARGLASEALMDAAAPALERQLLAQFSAHARGLAVPALEREVAARLAVEEGRALASEAADRLLTEQLKSLALQEAERVMLRRALAKGAETLTNKTLVAGGPTVGAVAARMAIRANAKGGVDEATASQEEPVALEVGTLHVLRLFDAVRLEDLPQLLSRFQPATFSPELPGLVVPRLAAGEPPPPIATGRYLGVFECL